jgi:hypothetical protein
MAPEKKSSRLQRLAQPAAGRAITVRIRHAGRRTTTRNWDRILLATRSTRPAVSDRVAAIHLIAGTLPCRPSIGRSSVERPK